MLKITVPGWEEFNNKTQEFSTGKETTISLEHSLISIAKWESKFHKHFLNNSEISSDELIEYVKFMTLTPNVDPEVFLHLTKENYNEIDEYIKDPMTATTFSSKRQTTSPKKEIITAEIIYYWMVSLNIPFECQKWHINRLLTLIRVVSIKNAPSKKMSKKEAGAQTRSLNAARRARHGSRG